MIDNQIHRNIIPMILKSAKGNNIMKNKNVLTILLGTTFLTSPAFADGAEVTADYLNSLSLPQITWNTVSTSGSTAVEIDGNTFYYTYDNTKGYTEESNQYSSTSTTPPVSSDDVSGKLFRNVDSSNINGAIGLKGIGDQSSVSIISDFVNNHSGEYGGGITISASSAEIISLGDISGVFAGNSAYGTTHGLGGAIYLETMSGSTTANMDATVNKISGNFINNKASATGSDKWTHGGAIDNHGRIQSIDANFIGNIAEGSGQYVYGGALNNGKNYSGGYIGSIHGNFIGNQATSTGSSATGGAIRNTGTIDDIVNSNFLYNAVSGNSSSTGGAIYSTKDLKVSADNGTSLFEGNTANGESNAIYMLGAETGIVDLNLRAENGGELTFNDDIDGEYYDISISGDDSGEVVFNQTVDNVNNIDIDDGGVMRMGTEALINTQDFTSTTDGSHTIKVDIEVDRANEEVKSGLINVEGEVSGDYKVIVNSLNRDGYKDANTIFLSAPNDSDETDESFMVSRVIGNPHQWEALRNYGGETSGSNWYLGLTRYETPEVIAAIGLHQAAIEQTRSVTRNIGNKVAAGREYCQNCGVYDYNWDGEKLRNLWVLVNGENAQIDKHIDMEAKIWGIEAGFDMQKDPNNTLGVFASYRRGDYDLSGDGDEYRSSIGSDIDIDSYLAGLYYRYDRNLNWLFATIYGGLQQAEIKTNDGVTEFDTDGVELGAGVEVGRTIPLKETVTLTPSVGLYYNQVSFDDADDNMGKHYDWSTIRHLEAEAGVRLEKQFEDGKLYIKPSVIQTLTGNDKVKITGMDEADTYHDQTLGRIEVGGRYGFTDALSGWAWANYTFGNAYKATGAGVGVSYAW